MQTYSPYQNFVSVQSEEQARAFPVVFGASISFLDVNRPYIYIKSNFSQYGPPSFERYRLVREPDAPAQTAAPAQPQQAQTQNAAPVVETYAPPYMGDAQHAQSAVQQSATPPQPVAEPTAPEYMTREDMQTALQTALQPFAQTLEAIRSSMAQPSAPAPRPASAKKAVSR